MLYQSSPKLKAGTFFLQLLIFLLTVVFPLPSWAGWAMTVQENDGLFQLSNGGTPVVKSHYAFWADDWKWAGQRTTFKRNNRFDYSTTGVNRKLGFKLDTKIKKTSENQISWTFLFDSESARENIIGGGIEFNLDLAVAKEILGKPELLPNNRGWTWGNQTHKGIKVEFESDLKSVVIERENKIRASFFQGELPKGRSQFSMSITLLGGIDIKPTLGEQFGLENASTWPKDTPDWETFPIDLSYLNSEDKPAGKRGFIRATGDKLVFEDGTEARFWGTNITASTLFKTPKINITRQAKRIAAMGFNLVRIHHHDSSWVNPNIFGRRPWKNTQQLSQKSLDNLDWWIKSLKDEGIYVWLDLHAQRYLMRSDDIFAFDELRKKGDRPGRDLKGFNYVNLTIKNAMKRFNRDYVSHLNPYTNLAYKDEPAIIAMLITNENDITFHYGHGMLPDKNAPRHNEIYMKEAKIFAKQYGLSADKTWRTWVHGPSKLFLNDLEHRFNEDMIADLREAGVKVPIVTTNTWGNAPLSSLPSLTSGDMIDVHTYGEMLELDKNPLVAPSMTAWMSAGQVANKPMSITEWNVSPFPTPDRHTTSLFVASKAGHQGWDAIMQYAYAQNSLERVGNPTNWHSHNDPALLATLPAAALLYRNEHVKEASTTYYLSPGSNLFDEEISPITSLAIRTASEKGKLLIAMPKTKSLPWLKPSTPTGDAIVLEDYRQSVIDPTANSVTSDTGELFRNWDEGIYTINTKQTQAIMGWVGDKTIALADSDFRITTRSASLAVQSMDDLPINQSRSILISIAGIAIPYKDRSNRNKLPFRSEPIRGSLSIAAREGLRLSYIGGRGKEIDLPVDYRDGRYFIKLQELPFTHWLKLTELE